MISWGAPPEAKASGYQKKSPLKRTARAWGELMSLLQQAFCHSRAALAPGGMILAITFLLALAPRMSRAQGESPPVLDPADVFADAVQVVETLPILNADNDARMLWYFDPAAGEWRGYVYPDGLKFSFARRFAVRMSGTKHLGNGRTPRMPKLLDNDIVAQKFVPGNLVSSIQKCGYSRLTP